MHFSSDTHQKKVTGSGSTHPKLLTFGQAITQTRLAHQMARQMDHRMTELRGQYGKKVDMLGADAWVVTPQGEHS